MRSTPDAFSTDVDDFDLESDVCISEPRGMAFGERSTSVEQQQQPYRKLKPDEILDAKMRNFLVVRFFNQNYLSVYMGI